MAAHSVILAWRAPQTEEPGRPQSTGLRRVGHNLATEQRQQLSGLVLETGNALGNRTLHLPFRSSLGVEKSSRWLSAGAEREAYERQTDK